MMKSEELISLTFSSESSIEEPIQPQIRSFSFASFVDYAIQQLRLKYQIRPTPIDLQNDVESLLIHSFGWIKTHHEDERVPEEFQSIVMTLCFIIHASLGCSLNGDVCVGPVMGLETMGGGDDKVKKEKTTIEMSMPNNVIVNATETHLNQSGSTKLVPKPNEIVQVEANAKPNDNTKPSDISKPQGDTKSIDVTKSNGNIKSTEVAKPIESAKPNEDTKANETNEIPVDRVWSRRSTASKNDRVDGNISQNNGRRSSISIGRSMGMTLSSIINSTSGASGASGVDRGKGSGVRARGSGTIGAGGNGIHGNVDNTNRPKLGDLMSVPHAVEVHDMNSRGERNTIGFTKTYSAKSISVSSTAPTAVASATNSSTITATATTSTTAAAATATTSTSTSTPSSTSAATATVTTSTSTSTLSTLASEENITETSASINSIGGGDTRIFHSHVLCGLRMEDVLWSVIGLSEERKAMKREEDCQEREEKDDGGKEGKDDVIRSNSRPASWDDELLELLETV
jgi:hypothetical protein